MRSWHVFLMRAPRLFNPSPGRPCARTSLSTSVAVLLATGMIANGAQALPPNPQRPFTARTCEEALQRYREAEAGSPLISAIENAEVLAAARAQVRRLCKQDIKDSPAYKSGGCP